MAPVSFPPPRPGIIKEIEKRRRRRRRDVVAEADGSVSIVPVHAESVSAAIATVEEQGIVTEFKQEKRAAFVPSKAMENEENFETFF